MRYPKLHLHARERINRGLTKQVHRLLWLQAHPDDVFWHEWMGDLTNECATLYTRAELRAELEAVSEGLTADGRVLLAELRKTAAEDDGWRCIAPGMLNAAA